MRLNRQQWNTVTAAVAVSAVVGLSSFLGYHEGTINRPYKDSGGVWTVCTGVTGPDVIPGKTYTREECAALDAKHQAVAFECIDRIVKVSLDTQDRIGWASAAYSIGCPKLEKSDALRLLNAGKREEACASLVKNWHRGGGIAHLLDGRRADEAVLCRGELDA